MTIHRLAAFTFFALTPGLLAQSAPAPESSAHPAPHAAAGLPDDTVIHTFYLTNVTQQTDGNELLIALRNILAPVTRLIYLPSQQAITVRGTQGEVDTAQRLLHDLDRPRKPYRLTYTLTEIDNGKRVGTQHVALVVLAGGRTVLKQGSKVPIATGTYAPTSSTSNSGTQTQFTYLDIGLNIDASLDDGVDGVRLRTKVEQSGLATESSGVGPSDPIVRQTVLEGTTILAPGKPILLGSLDVPDSPRHIDLEVVLEPVR